MGDRLWGTGACDGKEILYMAGKTKKAKGRIKIIQQMCKSCGYCIEYCPKGGIKLEESYNEKGYYPARFEKGDCTGCGICAVVCPEAIIEVWRE
jgi:2-oxoglutarate ferredoxin oxidoreductase subunit delta